MLRFGQQWHPSSFTYSTAVLQWLGHMANKLFKTALNTWCTFIYGIPLKCILVLLKFLYVFLRTQFTGYLIDDDVVKKREIVLQLQENVWNSYSGTCTSLNTKSKSSCVTPTLTPSLPTSLVISLQTQHAGTSTSYVWIESIVYLRVPVAVCA